MKIDGAFCINLPECTERYRLFQEESSFTKIPIERIDGVDGRHLTLTDHTFISGSLGNTLANINALMLAKSKGIKNLLLLEDDAQLNPYFDELLEESLHELPEDYFMLRLHPSSTSSNQKKEHFSTHLDKTLNGDGTYGIIVNSMFYDLIIEILENVISEFEIDGTAPTFDSVMVRLMPFRKFYQTKKILVYHRNGFSFRTQTNTSYDLERP